MNKYFLLLAFLFLCLYASAQTQGKSTIYAYKQDVLPGANRGVITEGGSEVQAQGSSGKNYFIYIASSSRIYPAEMWINGVAYSVRMEIINNTPVEMDLSFNQEKKQLVPKTALKVLKLTPAPYTQTKYFGDISRIAANNELVIVYKQNGKFFYNSVKNMKELEAAAMQ